MLADWTAMPKPNRHRNRSKNDGATDSSRDLSAALSDKQFHHNNNTTPAVACASINVCLDRSPPPTPLSIEQTEEAARTCSATDNVDNITSRPQDAPPSSLSPVYTPPAAAAHDRARMTVAEAEEKEAEELKQSLSEMVLVKTNKILVSSSSAASTTTLDYSVDGMFMLPPADPGGSNTNPSSSSIAVVVDPFARERQKRLLPSNTVSVGGAGSFEGRLTDASSEDERSTEQQPQQQQRRQNHQQTLHLPTVSQHQEEMCHTLIRDLNKYGVCVLDEFLGEERGQQVLSEVVTMYSAGKFRDGQLVQAPTKAGEIRDQKHIRGDKITWIGGREPGCSNIGFLINQVSFCFLSKQSECARSKQAKLNAY